jgi:hypothetical protein
MANWRPGKKDPIQSTVTVQTRVTPKDRDRYVAIAAFYRLSLSEWTRRLMEDADAAFRKTGERLPRVKSK